MQASQTTTTKTVQKKKTFIRDKVFYSTNIHYRIKKFRIRDIFAPKLDTNLYDDETVKYINLFPLGKATFYHLQ